MAAVQNDANANFNLGVIYINGDGVDRDFEIGVRYMSKAASLGMGEADEILTTLNQQTEADTAKIVSAIKSDDQARVIAAAEQVAIMKDSMGGQPQQSPQSQAPQLDMEEMSTEELINIANGSNNNFNLEELQDKAVNLLQNQEYDELISLLNEMVGEGSGWSMHYLAGCYTYGYGVEIDMDKANRLHLAAAEMGLPEAQMAFGRNLVIGNGIEKDIEKGVQYLTMAADNGIGFAAYSLGQLRLERNHKRSRQDYFEAAQFFDKAAQLGDPRGMQRLAWLYTEGLGVEANDQEALSLNIAAARLGAGRNEPALISYHQNIAKAIGSDRLIPLYEDQDN